MQPLVHLLPVVILLIGSMTGSVYASRKAFLYSFLFTSFYFCVGLVRGTDTAYYNIALSWVLLTPFYMFIFRFRGLEERDFLFLIRAIAWMSILEFGVGFVQLIIFQGFKLEFTGNAWDKVVGTTLSQSSHVYSLKMLFQGLILTLIYKEVKKNHQSILNLVRFAAISAFLGALISSYMVGIIMSVFFLVMFYSLRIFKSLKDAAVSLKIKKSRSKIMIIQLSTFILFFSLGVTVFAKLQPGNFKMITLVADKLLSVDFSDQYKFQKLYAFEQTFDRVIKKDITTFLVGLGPGQYSSRAALILTGDYLYPHPSYFPVSMSEETRQIIWPLWNDEQQAKFRGSVLALPSSSLISVIAEFGVIGLLILLLLSRRLVFINVQRGEGFSGSFVALAPIFMSLFFAQLVLDLWLEFASFTVFMNLIFIMCLSMIKKE